jgi:anaerobic selenocysteine-containing dehydrogenase
MITHSPAWAKGMRKLGPGIYLDSSGALHFSMGELAESLGVPNTEENARIIQESAEAAIREVFGTGLPTTIVESPGETR